MRGDGRIYRPVRRVLDWFLRPLSDLRAARADLNEATENLKKADREMALTVLAMFFVFGNDHDRFVASFGKSVKEFADENEIVIHKTADGRIACTYREHYKATEAIQ